MRRFHITNVRLTSASLTERRLGLLGYVSLDMAEPGLHLDGIALRRTEGGRLRLSFPVRTDRQGREHPLVRPLSGRVRDEIEAQVLAQLGIPVGVGR